MRRKNFGYDSEEEPTKLEKKLGFVFVDKDKDSFEIHRDKPVQINVNGSAYIGIYRGLNENGLLVLFPALVRERIHYTLMDISVGPNIYYWNDERPELINKESVQVVGPISEERLNSLVEMSKSYIGGPEYQI